MRGHVVEFLSYEGTLSAIDGPAAGRPPRTSSLPRTRHRSAVAATLFRFRRLGSRANELRRLQRAAAAARRQHDRDHRAHGSDPALPVGFEDQLFATLTDASGAPIPTTFTWSSESPAIASIDQIGVFHALAAGDRDPARHRDRWHDGDAGTANPGRGRERTALYAGNAEFGEPADSDPSDDFMVRYAQFTASYNPIRGTPNWVAYELDSDSLRPRGSLRLLHVRSGHCRRRFTATRPPTTPAPARSTATGSIAVTWRGRSIGRRPASTTRARSVHEHRAAGGGPQPGAVGEFRERPRRPAPCRGKEVYIVTGVAGNKGTVKNEGKIVIPTITWKVAVIMPHDQGLANVVDYRDLEVIAVNMPNEPGVRSVNWETYKTTVDAIEALTGYNLLALLQDKVENASSAARCRRLR